MHAIINEARKKRIPIDIQFTDIKQCFDAIWLKEAINDLYTSGVDSRNLNLLYEGNTSTNMSIDTPLGATDRIVLTNLVMQGSITGGILCSNQISKLCNRTWNEGENAY